MSDGFAASGEARFIDALRALAIAPGARGLADDAATLEIGGETLVLTHDAMVEGRHWLPGTDMADVAWKLVAVNLSDLAAMGAEPLGVLLGHTLGDGDERFIAGLAEVLAAYDVPLLGGDTVAGEGPRTLGCTAIGRATHRPAPSRSGAKAGDAVYLVGPIGAAMAGFDHLVANGIDGPKSPLDSERIAAFLRPQPLLAKGARLAPLVTAMMDVSDGLLLDASRMAQASGVAIDIDFAAIPFAERLDDEEKRQQAMRWGDDYALLFTASPETRLPVPAQRVGTVRSDAGEPVLIDGVPLADDLPLGYSHG